jgi:hypothetical protein
MDRRIEFIEDFAYHNYMGDSDEEEHKPAYTTMELTLEHQIPPTQIESSESIFSNYQYKRPAFSPADDIRQVQYDINSRISRMDENIQDLFDTV